MKFVNHTARGLNFTALLVFSFFLTQYAVNSLETTSAYSHTS